MSRISHSDIALALLAIAGGGYALLVASGVIPIETANNTPLWVVALCGVIFVVGGAMILLRNHSRTLDLLAAIILGSFALTGAWVSIYGAADGMSGGIPFLPRDANVTLGRIMFGFGAFLSFLAFVYAIRRYFRSYK